MNKETLSLSFVKLQEKLSEFSREELLGLAKKAERENPWFTEKHFFMALDGVIKLCSEESLKVYQEKYDSMPLSDKMVGLVLAGNIPAVGFHDVLICLLAGCKLKIKMSSDDTILLTFILQELIKLHPEFKTRIDLVPKLVIDDVDAIIATGSNNTARYFEQYFSRKPNVIRKSRTSVAILNGSETQDQLKALTDDVFQYYGLGCRNVSKVLTFKNTDLMPFLGELEKRTEFNNHTKYDNNYLYYKSIYLVNREEFLDTESILIKESDDLNSPISVLYYQRFENENDLDSYLKINEKGIQCVVGANAIDFGMAQYPGILDYADQLDVRVFIHSL